VYNRRKYPENRKKTERKALQWLPLFQSLTRITTLTVAIALLTLFFVFCHDLLIQCRFFAVESIEIRGLNHLTPEAIQQMTRIHAGTNTLSIHLDQSCQTLQRHPWIREVDIQRDLPSTIIITIQEQVAQAVVDFSNIDFLMNRQGEIFKKREFADTPFLPPDLPKISGLKVQDLNLNGKFQNASHPATAVREIISLTQSPQAILPVRFVEQIHVDRDLGVSLDIKESSELYCLRTLVLGFDHYAEKYRRLQKIISYIKTNRFKINKNLSRLDSIDLHHINRVVVRPSKDFIPHEEGTKEV
jgi:cell division protein FtsQ